MAKPKVDTAQAAADLEAAVAAAKSSGTDKGTTINTLCDAVSAVAATLKAPAD